MPDKIKIAHISDLHFSSGAIQYSETHKHSISHLKGIEAALDYEQPIDHVLITGDITNNGDFESLRLANDWIFHDIGIGGGERTGLRLGKSSVGIVPGNHDAYNSRRDGSMTSFMQRSLLHYNKVFTDHSFKNIPRCKYEWLPFEDSGIFIAYLDSSMLGDPTSEKIDYTSVNPFDLPARGKVTIEQSEQLLEWNDMGLNGVLPESENTDKLVSIDKFHRSLKILIMHHYIFEPPYVKTDKFLKLQDGKIVFRNLAMADFDLMCCGHKHIPCSRIENYSDNFDDRAKHRYLFNIFRRACGIHMLPIQLRDESGLKIGVKLSNWFFIIYKSIKKNNGSYNDVVEILRSALEDPKQLTRHMLQAIKYIDITATQEISKSELKDIRSTLSTKFTKRERKKLNNAASIAYNYIKDLGKQKFVQLMAGSATKKVGANDYQRSFNIYEIERLNSTWKLYVKRYDWNNETYINEPATSIFEFHDKRKPWSEI